MLVSLAALFVVDSACSMPADNGAPTAATAARNDDRPGGSSTAGMDGNNDRYSSTAHLVPAILRLPYPTQPASSQQKPANT